MSPLWIFVAAMVGLMMGSSQRAMIFQHAHPPKQPPRIQCPHCERILVRPGWRCPNCKGHIGPPRFSVELCTAAVFALLAWRIDQPLALGASLWVASVGVALAFIEAQEHRLPDRLTFSALAGAVLLLMMARFVDSEPNRVGRALMGGIGMAAVYLIIAAFSDIGYGPTKLALSLGVILGWYGRTVLIVGIVAGIVIGAAYAVGRPYVKRAHHTTTFDHSPPMLLGTLVSLLILL